MTRFLIKWYYMKTDGYTSSYADVEDLESAKRLIINTLRNYNLGDGLLFKHAEIIGDYEPDGNINIWEHPLRVE